MIRLTIDKLAYTGEGIMRNINAILSWFYLTPRPPLHKQRGETNWQIGGTRLVMVAIFIAAIAACSPAVQPTQTPAPTPTITPTAIPDVPTYIIDLKKSI